MLYQNLLLAVDKETKETSKDVREQIKCLCSFFTKDWDNFKDCFIENDIIPDKNERDRLKNVCKIGHIQNWLLFVIIRCKLL